jgi:hypothetical protein
MNELPPPILPDVVPKHHLAKAAPSSIREGRFAVRARFLMLSKLSAMRHLFSGRWGQRAMHSRSLSPPLRFVLISVLVNVLTGLYHQGTVKNDEDLKNLLDKLHQQLDFIRHKTSSLTDSRFRPSRSSIQGLVKSLEAYMLFVAFLNVDSSLIAHAENWIPFKISSSHWNPKNRVEFESTFTRCLRWIRIRKRLIAVVNNWMDPSSNSWLVSGTRYLL